MERYTGLLGIAAILAVAWLLSANKRAIKLRVIFWGLSLQFAFAVLVLKTDFGKVFQAIGVGVNAMLEYAVGGLQFRLRPPGRQERTVRRGVRLPGAAHRHLHRALSFRYCTTWA